MKKSIDSAAKVGESYYWDGADNVWKDLTTVDRTAKRDFTWQGGRDGFEGIYERGVASDRDFDEAEAQHGSFKSFADAKADALGYFCCDRDDANEAIQSIREIKDWTKGKKMKGHK